MFFHRYYYQQVRQLLGMYKLHPEKPYSLNIVYADIVKYDVRLADMLIADPSTVLKDANDALRREAGDGNARLYVRVSRLPQKKLLVDELSEPYRVGTLVSIDGNVRRISGVHPRVTVAVFECARCGNKVSIPQEGDRFLEPAACGCNEKRRGVFRRLDKESSFIKYQRLRLQESYEMLPPGSQPKSIDVELTEDLCGQLVAGQRVVVNGILGRVQRVGRDGKKTDFDLVLRAVSIEYDDTSLDTIQLEEADIEMVKTLSGDECLVDKLVQSLAPSIYGYEEVKLGILLMLFSGTTNRLPDGRLVRGLVHVLLIGDPGIAKSQLLQYVERIAPRATFTSGKGTSTAGLTAAVTRDSVGGRDDQQWIVEAGALPLSDRGVCIIDEIGQMADNDKSALHQAMEDLRITIRKAGLNSELSCRCNVLAAGNPKMGRFDPYDDLAGQINMTPTLLSRFDLVYTLLDTPEAGRDARVSDQIIRVRHAAELVDNGVDVSNIDEIKPVVPHELLRKYIGYARQLPSPVLSAEAMERAKQLYLEMRRDGNMRVTARQLEGIIRLSEASARMRLSNTITLSDVELAARVIRESLRQTARDPQTGRIDADIITVGVGQSQRDRWKLIKSILLENKKGLTITGLKQKLSENGYDPAYLESDLRKYKTIGEVFEHDGVVRLSSD